MPKPETIIDIKEIRRLAEEARGQGYPHDINVVFSDVTRGKTEKEAEKYIRGICDILNNKR